MTSNGSRPLALLVEDDEASLGALAEIVRGKRFDTLLATSLEQAGAHLEGSRPDLVLVDLVLPDGNGTELLERLGEEPWVEVVVISGRATVDSAIEALRHGAYDYLTKPLDVERLERLLTQVLEKAELRGEIRELRTKLRELGRFGSMIGPSAAMQRVYDLIEKVAPTDTSVLIIGESGTGKELAAETLHRLSPRRHSPYLTVNCGAISPNLIESELFGHEKGSFTGATRRHLGYFERCSGGTLFLDEVTEMPLELQVKLLRVLESRRILRVGGHEEIDVDVRVLAATNRAPDEAVKEGNLRKDLFYRLNVFPLELPPLRQRAGDAEVLALSFLDRLNAQEGTNKRFEPAALDCLLGWHWPGNVRELKNVVERAFILADDRISTKCLPNELSGEAPPSGPSIHVRVGTTMAEAEKKIIMATLEQLDGHRRKTAEVLGLSVKTLYNRLKEHEKDEGGG
jgi:DNA-binding NtrC family response regulator